MILSNCLILCHLLLLLPSVFPSIRAFSNELVLRIRWPKYWCLSFSNIPSNNYWGLISFGIDWFDLLSIQGTLESLLQHHNSKASILWLSTFIMVHLSHPYMTTAWAVALTIQTFVSNHELTLIQIQHLRILLCLPSIHTYLPSASHSENPSSQPSHTFFFSIIQNIQSSFRVTIPVLLTNRKATKLG